MPDPIICNIIEWDSYHIGDYNPEEIIDDEGNEMGEEKKYIIDIFAKTDTNKSVYIKVTDFTPFFFIELNSSWDSKKINLLKKSLKHKLYGLSKKTFLKCDVVERHKLYGFTAEKSFKFLRLIFSNSIGMRKASYQFKKGINIPGLPRNLKFNIYESNIDPILRCMHIKNISSFGWIEINKYNIIDDNNTTDISIETKWTNLTAVDRSDIAPLKIMSFDIECTSSDGGFPQASRDGDKIIQIGSTFNILGQKDCYYKSMITLDTCDLINDVDVIACETEDKLIEEWCKMLLKQDPDIITGWNIFGFDEKYIYDRAIKLNIKDIVLKLGRCSNRNLKFIEKSLSSSALGDNKLYYFNMQGRVQLDLMKVVQRDYKLDSYKLDSVAEEFINGKVLDIKVRKRLKKTELKITNVNDIIVGNFIKLSVPRGKFDTTYYNNGIKLKIINIKKDIITIEHIFDTTKENMEKSWNWGLVKDDIKPNDIFRLQEGTSSDRKLVAEYCIQDCILCNKLMEKLYILINNIAMANVCSVPLSYIFLRGQGIKVLSLVGKFCRQKNYLIPTLENIKDQGYEGAIVFPPKIGFYKSPITVLDYASLYPSSMIHRNLSHEMFVKIDGEYDNLDDYIYHNITFTNSDKTETTCRFAQKKDKSLGIMPTILQHLLNQRKAVKKEMKKEKDQFKESILDGQQLAYKLTANSIYGQIGSSFSAIYKKEIAASTTATGRYMLEFARDYMEQDFPKIVLSIYNNLNNKEKLNKILQSELQKLYNDKKITDRIKNVIKKILDICDITPKTIYGDTDSVFIDFQLKYKNTEKIYEENNELEFGINLGIIAGDLIKSKLEFPHDLEYEKTFWPFCIFSKKRYVGNKYEFDYNKFKQNSMGIVLKRRDNAPIVKEVIGGIVDILLNEKDIEKSIKYMDSCINKLLNGEYDTKYFITSKTLKTNYVNRSRIPHVCLADRMKERDPGNAPSSNDRIPYIAIIIDDKKILEKKIKKNTIYINNSLDNFKDINIKTMKELYKKYKTDKNNNKIIEDMKEEIGFTTTDSNILDSSIYNKIYKEFIKFMEKIENFDELIKDDEIKIKIKDFIIKFGNESPNIIQGDRIEYPEYITEHNITIDYQWYLTNQILKPATQFYSLIIENINGYSNIDKSSYDLNDADDRCKIAEKLIFEKHLIKDKENKEKEKENEKILKKNNTNNNFKDDIEIINKVKKEITKKTRKSKKIYEVKNKLVKNIGLT